VAERSLQDSLHHGLLEIYGEEPGQAFTDALLVYLELLERWNRTYNLTAVRDPSEMVSRHLLDSLSVSPWVGRGSLLDAGTGAGLPGVPLAIADSGLNVTLLDSSGKKIRFLNQVRRELGLENIEPVQSRLESFKREGVFDTVISRAFSSLTAFAAGARHLCRADTRLLAMKGRLPSQEIEELPSWVRLEAIEKLSVPGLQEDRHLVIMTVTL